MADDPNFYKMLPTQSDKGPSIPTIASAATIAPTTFVTFVSGTLQIATITPPVSGMHALVLVFTTTQSGQFATTGNIQQSTTTATVNVPVTMVYDPAGNKYYYKT